MIDYLNFMLYHPHVFIAGAYIASVINLVITFGVLLWIRKGEHDAYTRSH